MKNFALNTVGGFVLLALLLAGTQGSLLFSGLAVGAAVALRYLERERARHGSELSNASAGVDDGAAGAVDADADQPQGAADVARLDNH